MTCRRPKRQIRTICVEVVVSRCKWSGWNAASNFSYRTMLFFSSNQIRSITTFNHHHAKCINCIYAKNMHPFYCTSSIDANKIYFKFIVAYALGYTTHFANITISLCLHMRSRSSKSDLRANFTVRSTV